MNQYLMSIPHFAGSKDHFIVEANSKEEALAKAKEVARKDHKYYGGNWYFEKITCVKKIQKKGVRK